MADRIGAAMSCRLRRVGRSVFEATDAEWLAVVDGFLGAKGTVGGRVHVRISVARLIGEFATPKPSNRRICFRAHQERTGRTTPSRP